MRGHSKGVCLFSGMQDDDGVESLTDQRISTDGRLGALAVHDEVAYDTVQPLPIMLLAHLRWKLEQWPACLCLDVCGIDDRDAAGAQALFDDTVQDRKCSHGRGLICFIVG